MGRGVLGDTGEVTRGLYSPTTGQRIGWSVGSCLKGEHHPADEVGLGSAISMLHMLCVLRVLRAQLETAKLGDSGLASDMGESKRRLEVMRNGCVAERCNSTAAAEWTTTDGSGASRVVACDSKKERPMSSLV